ncbi:aldo/keto reductase [Pseudomonas fluorescens]|uniref:Aldo-keto reductase IolS n=1 Tax=Pseudomonas fluorescens TaxID=294 RepID=A0A5E7D7N6_PSEFL|nr:aldo/keto reductase [Pseudomonas fluorescens]VVO03462.1 Aldo-keto reductase IolS [Pseudomonas fluorescens]
MKYRRLGRTGLKVSPLCLGMMSYGSPAWQPWVLEKSAARSFVKQALDGGINFFDTSDFYSYGLSEEALADATHGLVRREELVISTKVGMPMSNLPNEQGNSRKRIREGIDASLKRLKTDYVDLYLLHKWDSETPIEESIDAMEELVKAGKILYHGVSNFRTHQIAGAQAHLRSRNEGSGLAAMQLQYNLVYREEERETLPYCGENGIGVMVYSPLARGWLIGGDQNVSELTQRERTRVQQDVKGQALYGSEGDFEVRIRLHELAKQRGIPPSRIAMAWILARPQVSTILCGALEPHHLAESIAALDVVLSPEDMKYIEEPYRPGPLRTAGYKEILEQQKKMQRIGVE